MSNTLLSEDRESKALLFTNSESNELLEYMLDTESYNMTGGSALAAQEFQTTTEQEKAAEKLKVTGSTDQTVAGSTNQNVDGSTDQINAARKTVQIKAARETVKEQIITKEAAEKIAEQEAQKPTNILMKLFNDLGIIKDDKFNTTVNDILNNDNYNKDINIFKKINSIDKIEQTQTMINNMNNVDLSNKYKKMVSNLIKIQVYSTFTKKDRDYTDDFNKLIQLVNESLDSTSGLMESELNKTQQGGGKVNTINKYLKYKLKYMLLKMD